VSEIVSEGGEAFDRVFARHVYQQADSARHLCGDRADSGHCDVGRCETYPCGGQSLPKGRDAVDADEDDLPIFVERNDGSIQC